MKYHCVHADIMMSLVVMWAWTLASSVRSARAKERVHGFRKAVAP